MITRLLFHSALNNMFSPYGGGGPPAAPGGGGTIWERWRVTPPPTFKTSIVYCINRYTLAQYF